jgi:hypothetical protein
VSPQEKAALAEGPTLDPLVRAVETGEASGCRVIAAAHDAAPVVDDDPPPASTPVRRLTLRAITLEDLREQQQQQERQPIFEGEP